MHRRFFNVEKENSLVQRIEAVVGDDSLTYSEEVVPWLEATTVPLAQVLLPSVTSTPEEAPKETDIGAVSLSTAKKSSKRSAKRSATPMAPGSVGKGKRQQNEEAK